MLTKIVNYIKEHKVYLAIMGFFTLLFALAVVQVVPFADDYLLYEKALTYNVSDVISEFIDVYLHWGGGPTHGLAIIVLKFGFSFWKVLQVIMMVLSIHMIVKMIVGNDKDNDRKRGGVAFIFWCLFFLLHIFIQRETLYWFDGSMAYVLSTFLVISFVYWCYQLVIVKKEISSWKYFFIVLLGFFAGWNGPQSGAIATLLGFSFLVWQKFVQKEKINKVVLTSSCFCLLGFIILYFAPGNAARMSDFHEFSSLSLFGRIFYRVGDVVDIVFNHQAYPAFQIPTYLYLASLLLVGGSYLVFSKLTERKQTILKICNFFVVLYVLLYTVFLFVDTGPIHEVVSLFFRYYSPENKDFLSMGLVLFNYLFFGIYVCSLLGCAYLISAHKKSPLLLFAMMGAIGTQTVMVVSPYNAYRTTYITIFFLMIAICYLVYQLRNQKEILGIIFFYGLYLYDIKLAIFLTVPFVFLLCFWNDRKAILPFLAISLFMIAVSNQIVTIYNYRETRLNNEKNVQQIEKYKENGQRGELKLYALADERYCFEPIYTEIKWIRLSIIEYFDLKKDVSIVVQEP